MTLAIKRKTREKEVYSDIDLSFKPHPVTGDVSKNTNIDAVKKSIKNLILTNLGERRFDQRFGSRISSLLFEPLDTITTLQLQTEIKDVLQKYEKRATILVVRVIPLYDKNAFDVSISFRVNNITESEPIEIDFFLKRLTKI